MKEELTNKLLEYLSNFEQFTKAELPEVAKQILEIGMYEAKLCILIGVILLIIGLVLAYLSTKVDDYSGLAVTFPVVSGICITISVILLPCSIVNIKKIEIAPKVYLIDYVRGK
jgi:hypothetical protein